jgi:hypothetical protein
MGVAKGSPLELVNQLDTKVGMDFASLWTEVREKVTRNTRQSKVDWRRTGNKTAKRVGLIKPK